MNRLFIQSLIPTDFVYTGKLFYAVNDLAKNNYFPADSKLLVIHSGGLQGNGSLEKGVLLF
jgi:1-aminocyclopropane-1-carboxylate deaminase